MTIYDNTVSIVVENNVANYPMSPPYNPPEMFPEYPLATGTDSENNIYAMVRDLLYQLELDEENFGTASWNPFKGLVAQGDIVIIKPNLVGHDHPLWHSSEPHHLRGFPQLFRCVMAPANADHSRRSS